MVRLARAVVPGLPHYVTQRGNRRQTVFFSDEDYEAYRRLVAEHCAMVGVEIWSYCLMPNHVHLILVPGDETGLQRALGEAHRRYTMRINAREDWRGYLWQGRFASFVMDDSHVLEAARHVELNPVRAGLAKRAKDWPWSSAQAHLAGVDDILVRSAPLLDRVGNWRAFLKDGIEAEMAETLRQHERTGRPLGAAPFIADLEARLGRALAPRKPGRKPKPKDDAPVK